MNSVPMCNVEKSGLPDLSVDS